MTDKDAPTQASEPEAAPEATSCESLAALRDAHLELRRLLSEPTERRSSRGPARIRVFLKKAPEVGAFINDPKERKAAQTILDYWSAELAASPAASPDDFISPLLVPPDPGRVRSEGNQPPIIDRSDQRTLIRFSAQARRWRDSGRRDSDLLRDDATIEEASRLASQDTALAELVGASKDAIRKAKEARRRRWGYLAVGALAAVLIYGAGNQYWQFTYLPNKKLDTIDELRARSNFGVGSGAAQVHALKWFAANQPWLPPLDFSRIAWGGVTLEGLTLYAPGFVRGTFKGVSLKGAQLDGANFIESDFVFDDTNKKSNDFSKAVLKYTQFRNAKIASTSFAEADLFRAIFDKAELCQVDLTGANLRQASFWGTKMDTFTKEHLRTNAWWLVVGLPWAAIKELAAKKETEKDLQRLKASAGFNADLAPAIKDFQRSDPDSLERGLALNSIAWARAVWGVDVTGEQISEEEKARSSCGAEAVPTDAVQTADKAVCIVNKLNQQEPKGRYADLLANLRDTQAYVYMQNDKLRSSALSILWETASEADLKEGKSKFFENGDALFRYSIAQYAVGLNTKDEAVKKLAMDKFETAIKNYQPTHELHTLRDYLFVEPFEPLLAALNTRLWPGQAQEPTCPAAKSGAQ